MARDRRHRGGSERRGITADLRGSGKGKNLPRINTDGTDREGKTVVPLLNHESSGADPSPPPRSLWIVDDGYSGLRFGMARGGW